MRRDIMIVTLAGLFAVFAWWLNRPSQPTHISTHIKGSTSVDRARAPASGSAPAVPVARVTDASGRTSLKLAIVPQVAQEMQLKEDLVNRYRLGPQPPLPGAETFEMLKLKAVPRDQYDTRMGTLVSEKLGFAIFATGTGVNLTVAQELPVVAKKSNGMLGIVTGTILVTLKRAELADSLGQNFQLKLMHLDAGLRLAYYTAPLGSALDQVVASLMQDQAVEAVNLEIVHTGKRL